MTRLGTIIFQANDSTDIFFKTEVFEDGIEPSDEALLNIEDTQFDSDKAWVTGKVPRIKPVSIGGDTAIIEAWFSADDFQDPFVITLYIECELAEELVEVRADEKAETGKAINDAYLEPMEVNL